MTSSPAPAATRRCRRAFAQALDLSQQLLSLSEQAEERLTLQSARVSAWSVAQHLDHLAQANRLCADAIARILDSPPSGPEPGLTLAGHAVLLTGRIPRGRGSAPSATVPSTASTSETRNRLREAHQAVTAIGERLGDLDGAQGRLGHPALGGFTAFQWLRFIAIHTRHHLKIIKDIQRAESRVRLGPGES